MRRLIAMVVWPKGHKEHYAQGGKRTNVAFLALRFPLCALHFLPLHTSFTCYVEWSCNAFTCLSPELTRECHIPFWQNHSNGLREVTAHWPDVYRAYIPGWDSLDPAGGCRGQHGYECTARHPGHSRRQAD